MAVYKATYCYPFLNTFDGRVTATSENSTPAQYLKCKIESSNKIITGYSIEILDENNNIIFPYSAATRKISPVVELQQGLGKDINSGYNGTYLNIPFFQNNASENRITSADKLAGGSYNAVYYRPKFKAHYLIGTTEEFSGVDNVANWSYDTNSYEMYYEGFNGILNEELVAEGELVFVASPSNTYGGIWKIQSSGRLIHYTLPGSPSTEIDSAYLGTEATVHGECFVTITNGIYHSRVYETNVESGEITSFTITNAIMWKDVSGNLINLSNEAGSYKWVITLYQSPELGSWSNSTFMPDYRKAAVGILKDSNGTNIEPANIGVTHTHPWYCDYSDMPIDWYDMSLNRGTILGSTKDRIQVSDYSGKYIPGDGSTDPVVLQGKYIQLFGSGDEQLSVRAYISSYDASYGHIYPLSGSFTNDQIGVWPNATIPLYAQIFKYSNDPETVLASDRVRVATTANISLSGTMTIDGISVKSGDYVLVKDQTLAKNNGIYIVSGSSWSRAGSYNTWGKFIGKTFFVEEGLTQGQTNWSSLARAGGSLYNGSGSSGDSPLNFSLEKPMLLFPNLINKTVSFLWTEEPTEEIRNYDVVDGIECHEGDTCLCSVNGHLYSYGDEDVSPRWYDTGVIIGSNQEIVRILYGKTYGNTYYSFITGHVGLTDIPVSAYILRNTTTKTYIKPYVGLDDKMALVFNNNQKITYSDSSQKGYLLMTSVNTKLWYVEHAELAAPLQSWGDSLESNMVPFSYDVKSFYKASDENPFSLYDNPYLKLGTGNGGYTDITTYQPYWVKDTTLDEVASKYFCVFYNNHGDYVVQTDEVYQVQPIIRGNVSVDLKTFTDTEDTIYGAGTGEVMPLEDDFFYDTTNEHYYRWVSASSRFTQTATGPAWDTSEERPFEVVVNNTPFYVVKPSVTAFASRYITLQGHYYQWQQASWESYRWILTDIDGNVLQDTGKKYDQSMSVTFYGLSNESADHKNHYYAILLVEDELGHSLSFSIHIVVDSNSVATVSIPFFAEYDCNTHSVKLSYQANSFVKPSILLNESDSEVLAYVSNNDLLTGAGLWDDSLIYGWDSSYALKPNNNYTPGKYNTYYTSTSPSLETQGIYGWANITGYKTFTGEEYSNLVQQRNYLSNTELLGIKYEYYFERYAQTQDVSSHQLTVLEQEDNGEFSVQAKVKLSDNFCSNLIETAVDYGDKTHQLHIQLAVPLKFTALDGDELNNYRDGIQLNIFTDQTQSGNEIIRYLLKNSLGDLYKWRQSTDASKTCYYLRTEMKGDSIWNENFATGINRPRALDKNSEYLHYLCFTHTAEAQPNVYFYPFFINIEDTKGDRGVINSTKFLGNSCLVREDDLALVNAWEPLYYVLSKNDDNTRLTFTENRNFFLKYAPCYWTENRPRVKLFQKTGLIDNPMNLLYNTDDLTYDEATGALISWPDDTNENTFYWQEYDQEQEEDRDDPTPHPHIKLDTNLSNWKKKSPTSWGEVFGKNISWNPGNKDSIENAKLFATDCGWKPLTYRPRNYGWLSNASFIITIRVSNIDALGSAADSDVTVTGENPTSDYTYTTNILVDGTKVGSISIQKIRDEAIADSYLEPSY